MARDRSAGVATRIAGLLLTERRSPEPVGERAAQFAEAAVADGLLRATRHFGASSPPIFTGPQAVDDLTAWCSDRGVERLITAWAPVGPVAQALSDLRRTLGAHGIELLRWRRPWDSVAWPHAKRGFFRFKKQIPSLAQRFCEKKSDIFREN